MFDRVGYAIMLINGNRGCYAALFYFGEGIFMDYAGFGERQAAYLRRSVGCWLNVAEGGKRAGKNVLNVLAFAMHLEATEERLHLAAGVSAGAARVNILDCNGYGLARYFAGRCREGRYGGRFAIFIQCGEGEKIVIFEGGGRANDAARIKGMSFGSVYVTEANEVHRSFLFETIDRTLASGHRKLFFDLNAMPPNHWFYADFLDMQEAMANRGENPGYNHGNFTIFDNKSISPQRVEELLNSYDRGSAWYRRDILGQRSGGDMQIYGGFGDDAICGRADSQNFVKFGIGIDVGGTDATVATLVGITDANRLVLIDGYYHKQGAREGHTHETYVREICSRIEDWAARYPGLLFGGAIFCESAEKLFRQSLVVELRRRGLGIAVFPSYKKGGILERIRLFDMLINQGRLTVAAHLTPWISAFYDAAWCEKAKSRGEWIRADNNTASIDCLDSAEYAALPYKAHLIRAN